MAFWQCSLLVGPVDVAKVGVALPNVTFATLYCIYYGHLIKFNIARCKDSGVFNMLMTSYNDVWGNKSGCN